MRPDLDDFDDMNQDASAEPRSRAMSWLVLGVAVTGFAALAYYAYQSGTRSLGDTNILEVAAEDGPIKEEPADAGGEEFPHQDKTIYDALAGGEENQKVEKLLPEPEEPVMPEPAIGGSVAEKPKGETTTYVNNAEVNKGEEDTFSAPPPNVEPVQPVPAAPVAAPVAAPEVKTETLPEPAPVAPAPVKEEVPPPAAAPAEKPKAEPKPAAASGDYKIQLGAFPSEEEAEKEWNRIVKKHGSIVKGSPIVLRVDDEKKGTFYRLRASGFASAAAAKAACAKLDAAKQPCFPAGK